ncbi:hypothetical protein [Actinomadura alba]|uniref:Uncharacterized protein n=1 Tax=Actinomadura alba TaxID=406431 RepID=A0ABR7LR27_9ACTN|nr:hypothetical protein [Actinomadura alba]MBC6467302.1 hypothetical protein [Actinomadura alba]
MTAGSRHLPLDRVHYRGVAVGPHPRIEDLELVVAKVSLVSSRPLRRVEDEAGRPDPMKSSVSSVRYASTSPAGSAADQRSIS